MISTEMTMYYMILLTTTTPPPKKKKERKGKLPSQGFPGGKESSCQFLRFRRHGFNLWVRKIPWRKKYQLTPVFLPGKFHGQRSLVGYRPWGCKQSDMTEGLSVHARTHTHTLTHIHAHTHTHTRTRTLVHQRGWGGLGLVAALLWKESFTSRGKEPWGMIMFRFYIDICFHGSTRVETFSVVHCEYKQFAKCQYALIKPGK